MQKCDFFNKKVSCHFGAYLLRKSAQMQFVYLWNDCHFPRSRSFEVIFPQKSPSPHALSLPSFIGTTKIDWEKSAKYLISWFFLRNKKNYQNSKEYLKSKKKFPKHHKKQFYANFRAYLTRKSAKMQFQTLKLKWPHFPRSRSFEIKFTDKVPLT